MKAIAATALRLINPDSLVDLSLKDYVNEHRSHIMGEKGRISQYSVCRQLDRPSETISHWVEKSVIAPMKDGKNTFDSLGASEIMEIARSFSKDDVHRTCRSGLMKVLIKILTMDRNMTLYDRRMYVIEKKSIFEICGSYSEEVKSAIQWLQQNENGNSSLWTICPDQMVESMVASSGPKVVLDSVIELLFENERIFNPAVEFIPFELFDINKISQALQRDTESYREFIKVLSSLESVRPGGRYDAFQEFCRDNTEGILSLVKESGKYANLL
jgi:hypothetical protein